jgi:LPPG:FO 2-phospho-L-lactate transferase
MKVTALAGGVGGAKLADGLARCLPPENLTIVVNTGDDFEHFGLTICPDTWSAVVACAKERRSAKSPAASAFYGEFTPR